jgi:hypothetical protein
LCGRDRRGGASPSCEARRKGEHVQDPLQQDHDPFARAVRGGLTDFGPDRSKVFSKSADDYLDVHDLGADEADVTEGSGGVWERLRYDWSDPNRVVMTTTDSNTWGGHSGHTYTFTRQPDGTTAVDVVVVREGKNFKGRVLGVVVGIGGKRFLGKALGNTVKAIEARNDEAKS